MHVYEHVHACLFPVSAVPDLTLLSVSGVLECQKRLAGRFNIQLAGSRSSYITAENAATPLPHLHLPVIILIPWLVSHPPPPLHQEPSPLCLLYCPWPLLERLRCVCVGVWVCVCVGLGGAVFVRVTALQSSGCPSALPLIVFDLNGLFFIWRLLPTPPRPPPTVRRTDAQVGRGKEEGSAQHDCCINRTL